MDYKKLFKTHKLRAAILDLVRFVPDKPMIRFQYRLSLKRRLNLKDPKRYTEKLQWYKLYYRNPVMHKCVDKYAVREFVRERGLEDILVPLYGRYDSIDEVDWEALPDSFVVKTTFGGGGLDVVLCRDKKELDIEAIRKKFDFRPGKVKYGTGGREWAYFGIPKAIVVEKLLVNEEHPESGVNDYKFFCYDGKAKFIYLDVDRFVDHKRKFFDRDWNDLNIISEYKLLKDDVPKPANLNEMIETAEKLASGFPYVRVDLYSVSGKIYFGEMTFYPWSGYIQFVPDEADMLFAKDLELRKFEANEG